MFATTKEGISEWEAIMRKELEYIPDRPSRRSSANVENSRYALTIRVAIYASHAGVRESFVVISTTRTFVDFPVWRLMATVVRAKRHMRRVNQFWKLM